MENERLTLTVEEAGRALGLSRATAYTLANNGGIPAIRCGKRLIVPKAALLKMLEQAGIPKTSS